MTAPRSVVDKALGTIKDDDIHNIPSKIAPVYKHFDELTPILDADTFKVPYLDEEKEEQDQASTNSPSTSLSAYFFPSLFGAGPTDNASDDPPRLLLARRLLVLIAMNAFPTRGDASCALYTPYTSSSLIHSCDPNAHHFTRGGSGSGSSPSLVIKAVKDIKEGDCITTCYYPPQMHLLPHSMRQEWLSSNKGIRCVCNRCSEPDTLRSMRCPSCQEGEVCAGVEAGAGVAGDDDDDFHDPRCLPCTRCNHRIKQCGKDAVSEGDSFDLDAWFVEEARIGKEVIELTRTIGSHYIPEVPINKLMKECAQHNLHPTHHWCINTLNTLLRDSQSLFEEWQESAEHGQAILRFTAHHMPSQIVHVNDMKTLEMMGDCLSAPETETAVFDYKSFRDCYKKATMMAVVLYSEEDDVFHRLISKYHNAAGMMKTRVGIVMAVFLVFCLVGLSGATW